VAKDEAQAADIEGPIGIKPALGKMRRKPDHAKIAARVARFADVAPVVPHVTPLNPGFFQLERMRASSATKKRGKVRAKVRGK
jgi:hypothetical protein